MIRVTFYFSSGREQSSHDCHTVEEAFERLQRTLRDTNMSALAWPVGTNHGVYNWQTHHEHTLAGFAEKMLAISKGEVSRG